MSVMDMNETNFTNTDVKAVSVQEAEIVAERTPEIIAAEICQIKDQTRKLVLNNSIEIGKRLCEAKEMVPHGEWGTWLERNVDYKQSTANKLMKIYEQYGAAQGELWGASAKSETFTNLTYSKALALLAVPEEEREEFVEKNDVESMSTRELQAAIKERNEALAMAEKAEKKEKEMQKELDLANKKLELEKERHDTLMKEAEKNKEDQLAEIERLKAELAAAEERPDVTLADAAEIARLKDQLKKAEQLGAERLAADEETARFKVLFQTVQNNFSDLMDAMYSMRNEEKRGKGKAAVRALFERLTKELDAE